MSITRGAFSLREVFIHVPSYPYSLLLSVTGFLFSLSGVAYPLGPLIARLAHSLEQRMRVSFLIGRVLTWNLPDSYPGILWLGYY